ncbi:MAG: class I SAM-dependent methyltransferase [Bellilinea sp.]
MDDDLFPASDFDAWAETYDQDVITYSGFPFEGYRQMLETVFRTAQTRPNMRVLDLGAGTGNLTALFSAAGCQVWGTDFSAEMVARARIKLPQVPFIQADIRAPWPKELPLIFDRIVSGYAFHHFSQAQKVELITDLAHRHLTSGGRIIIADLTFATRQVRAAARLALGDEWEEEYYWITSEDIPAFEKAGLHATFEAVSQYAGVFCIEPIRPY